MDLVGQKFGRLTVLERAENDRHHKTRWLCQCECGDQKVISGDLLRNGKTTSCGCFRFHDLTGQTFHFLTVLKRAENTKQGKTQWLCRCVCGKETIVPAGDLTRKKYPTKSCGCMSKHLISEHQKTHGMSRHPAWAVWHSLKQRCLDPNHPAYHNYGGRGITVCQEWQDSFERFWADMGSSYHPGLEIDRIDNSRGYCAENCRWTTRKINSRNKRTNRVIDTPYGKMTVAALAELTGIGVTTLLYRLDHGWPAEYLCVPPDFKNEYTTSGIAVRGTDFVYLTEEQESCVS